MIDVTLIGTGGLMPLPDRALASTLLKCEGKTILFDCGEGTQASARKAGVSVINVDIIALTHYHGDHILGLPGLLQTMQCMDRTLPLTIIGPKGIEKALAPILALAGETSYEIKLVEMLGDRMKFLYTMVPGFGETAFISSIATKHGVESIGYSFNLNRKGKFNPDAADRLGVPVEKRSLLQQGESVVTKYGVVYPEMVSGPQRKGIKVTVSGDTAECDGLIRGAEGADLFICEATFGDNEHTSLADERGHLTFSQAASIAKKANVKKLCLTHFSPRVVEPEEYLSNATDIFENTVLGADGLKIALDFED